MKLQTLAAAAFLTLFAGTLSAAEVESALASDSTLWTAAVNAESNRLELTRRFDGLRETLVVPATEDSAIESDPRLSWDRESGTLFVVWSRADEGVRDIRSATLRADGTWTTPIVLSVDGAKHAGLQIVLTHGLEPATPETAAVSTTFLHAAWWAIDEAGAAPHYALAAFEAGSHVSTDVSVLTGDEVSRSFSQEETSDAVHPPLAMVRAQAGVEVVFGERQSTAVNQVTLIPRRIASEARLWRPGRSGGGIRTPSAHLVSSSTEPVRSFVSNGRIVLYTPDRQFRFVVYENGRWTPVRMVALDETLTSDLVLDELKRTAAEGTFAEAPPQEE